LLTKIFFSYLISSVLAFIAHYGALLGLVSMVGVSPPMATAIGFVIGAVVSYLYNCRFTFTHSGPHASAFTRFVVVASVGFVINLVIFSSLLVALHVHYIVAQLIATAIVLVWGFSANRYWTFRH
jgi:putative flippase GtrA